MSGTGGIDHRGEASPRCEFRGAEKEPGRYKGDGEEGWKVRRDGRLWPGKRRGAVPYLLEKNLNLFVSLLCSLIKNDRRFSIV